MALIWHFVAFSEMPNGQQKRNANIGAATLGNTKLASAATRSRRATEQQLSSVCRRPLTAYTHGPVFDTSSKRQVDGFSKAAQRESRNKRKESNSKSKNTRSLCETVREIGKEQDRNRNWNRNRNRCKPNRSGRIPHTEHTQDHFNVICCYC